MLARLRAHGLAHLAGLGLLGLGLLIVDLGGCGLSTEGVSASCGQDVDCDDGNPCNVDTCESGKCAITPLPDGPADVQVPGDCKHATCEGGQAKQETDETDVDDGNPCTIDACVGDEPKHDVVPDDPPEPCSKGDDLIGTCIGGVCTVKCTSNAMCTDSNPCTEESCDIENQVCLFPGKHGAFVENTDPTDCLQKVCNETEAVDVPDDSEAPDDGNECTSDACVNGMLVATPLPDTACGVNGDGVCNSNGQCVGCNSASDCGADPGSCQHWECNSEICQIVNEPLGHAGDPALGQTSNDCKLAICDGNGGETVQQDAGDLPNDDGNPCTNQACSGTDPSWPAVPAGTSCPSGVCNPTGLCVGCNTTSDCSAAGTCKTVACVNTVCSYSNVPGGQDPKNDCSSNPPCGNTGDCNGNGACAVVASGTVCAAASCSNGVAQYADTCNGSGTCVDNGTDNCAPYTCGSTACKTTCTGNGDCQAPLVCASGGLCRLPKGSPCSNGGECATGNCVDNRCCSSASCGNCQDCNLATSLGDCANVPNGTADSPGCTGANVCDGSGNCAAPQGSSCSMDAQCLTGHCADSVCCDTACSGTCQACVASKTPSPNGTCANIDNATDPDEECTGGGGSHICCNGTCGPNCP